MIIGNHASIINEEKERDEFFGERIMRLTVIVALVLGLVSAAPADMIEKVQVKQTYGATAQYQYVNGNGDLEWSGGAGGYIYTDAGTYINFDGAVIDADFDLSSDDSTTGGVAKARFDLVGSWTVSLYDYFNGFTDAVVVITGTMNSGGGFDGKYWEAETGFERLDGKGWVTINSFWANSTWVASVPGLDDIEWDEDFVAGLDSDVTLDSGTGDISSYGQDYTSNNGLTVTLFSNQGLVVPEPATMALLGLGALLCRKFKKA